MTRLALGGEVQCRQDAGGRAPGRVGGREQSLGSAATPGRGADAGGGAAEELAAGQDARSRRVMVEFARVEVASGSVPSSPSRRGSGSRWRPSSRPPARPASSLSSRGDSPTLEQLQRGLGIAAVGGQLLLVDVAAGPPISAGVGLRGPWPGGRRRRSGPRRSGRASVIIRSASLRDGLDVGRVVHQHQRLQRRVGPRAADGAGLAVGGVEGGERRRRRRSASRTCTSSGGTGPCRGSARRSGRSSWRRRRGDISSSQSPAGW